jgi:uncharacterized membrane protein
MSSFMDRVVGAAKLDVRTYEEVEADPNALGQAVGVILLASIAAGIGSGLGVGLLRLIIDGGAALIGWMIWAFLTYFIGTKLLPQPQTKSDFAEMFRTIGFSASPGLLQVFGLLPAVGGVVTFVVQVWMLVAMVIAVRQALDYTSTWRAVGVCVIGWLVMIVAIALVDGGLFAGMALL